LQPNRYIPLLIAAGIIGLGIYVFKSKPVPSQPPEKENKIDPFDFS